MAQSQSHCEIVGIYVVTLLQLARSLRSLARCDCACFVRFVAIEADRTGVLSGLFWRVKKCLKKKFHQNETRSTVSICLPLAITVDKKI